MKIEPLPLNFFLSLASRHLFHLFYASQLNSICIRFAAIASTLLRNDYSKFAIFFSESRVESTLHY